MKALILILLLSSYAAAQDTPTIADIARQERARRGQTASKVYTMTDVKPAPAPAAPDTAAPGTTPAAQTNPPAPGTAPAPAAGAAPATGAAPADAAATEPPKEDPLQKWLAETEKLRAQIRQLVDQESATQLDINNITNRIYTPVTSVSARDSAQAELGVAQNKLQALREQINKARAELQVREQEGPPKKQ
jgi:hypothetical protein